MNNLLNLNTYITNNDNIFLAFFSLNLFGIHDFYPYKISLKINLDIKIDKNLPNNHRNILMKNQMNVLNNNLILVIKVTKDIIKEIHKVTINLNKNLTQDVLLVDSI